MKNCHQPAIHLTVVPVFLTFSQLTQLDFPQFCQVNLVKRPTMCQRQSFGPWRPESAVSSTVLRSTLGCLPPWWMESNRWFLDFRAIQIMKQMPSTTISNANFCIFSCCVSDFCCDVTPARGRVVHEPWTSMELDFHSSTEISGFVRK